MLNLPYVRVPPTFGRLGESGAAARTGSRSAVGTARARGYSRIPSGRASDSLRSTGYRVRYRYLVFTCACALYVYVG